MADPERASGEGAVDPKLAEAIDAACARHQAFLDYIREYRVFVDPDEIAKVQERLRGAKEAATAEFAGAVATAAAAARNPRLAEHQDLAQVPGFRAVSSRMVIGSEGGRTALSNYRGREQKGSFMGNASQLLHSSKTGEGTEHIRGAIVVSEQRAGVLVEYAYTHNGRAVTLEILADKRLAETQIVPAVMGNPGILHQHMGEVARGRAGIQYDATTFAEFRAAEPTTDDFGPDSVVVFQSHREGAGQYEKHFIPLVPITPEAAAVPPQKR